MKVLCRIIAIVCTLSLACSNCMLLAYATETTSQYENLSEYFSEETVFSNDKIIVVLDNASSVSFKSFDTEFQNIIECSTINDLTGFKTQKIKTYIENQFESVQSNEAANLASNIELDKYHKILCLNLKTPGKETVLDAIEKLNKLDGVLCAFPDFEISAASSTSNYNTNQIDTSPSDIYNLLSLNQAWSAVSDLSQSTVRVAVIDSGIDKNHSALRGKIDESTSAYLIGYEGEYYDDFDEYVGSAPIDNNGHGTHVAGIIAASLDSETGMKGVCSSVELISIKVLDDRGKGDFSDLVAAMAYVASLDDSSDEIDIVNISIEAKDFFTEETNQELLTSWIADYNGLVICAAGNGDENLDQVNIFPASIDGNRIITVGASTIDDTRWHVSDESGSNYNGSVDIFAPGVDIVSCIASGSTGISCPGDSCTSTVHVTDGYHALTGTSMAAPFVTGVAALMLSVNSTLTAEDIKSVITNMENVDYSTSSNDPISELFMICDSGGRLNAYKAISAVIDTDTPEEPEVCLHEARTYHYTSTTHTQYCASCGEQVGTPQTHGLMRMNESDPTYHTVMCLTCGYSANELHSASYINSDSNRHLKHCSVCNYNGFENHDLYVQAVYDGDNGCDIACRDCSYSFHCDCNPEYGGGDINGHYATCPEGYFDIFEGHVYGQYTDLGNGNHTATCVDCGYEYTGSHILRRTFTTDLFSHNVECSICGYESTEAHTWVSAGTGYKCNFCGMLSDSVPGIMSLPDPELEAYLASLSVEEREEFIASLPEDQVARVTALLPSDDEHLTE